MDAAIADDVNNEKSGLLSEGKSTDTTLILSQKLPFEQLLILFSYFPVAELVTVQRVCHSWRLAAQDKSLWKNFTLTLSGIPEDEKYIKTMPALRNIAGNASNNLVIVILENVMELSQLNCKFKPPLSSSQIQSIIEKYPNIESINLEFLAADALESANILKASKNLKEVKLTTHPCLKLSHLSQVYSVFLDDQYFNAIKNLDILFTEVRNDDYYYDLVDYSDDNDDYFDQNDFDLNDHFDLNDDNDDHLHLNDDNDHSHVDSDDDCNDQGDDHNYDGGHVDHNYDGDDDDDDDDDQDDDIGHNHDDEAGDNNNDDNGHNHDNDAGNDDHDGQDDNNDNFRTSVLKSVIIDLINRKCQKLSSLKLTMYDLQSEQMRDAVSMCTQLHNLDISLLGNDFQFLVHINIENMNLLRSLFIDTGYCTSVLPVLYDSLYKGSWVHMREASFKLSSHDGPKVKLLKAVLENMKQLRKLNYCDQHGNTGENELKNIGSLPHLNRLIIDGLTSFTEEGATHMSQCRNLTYFLLHAHSSTGDNLHIAHMLSPMKKLKRMVLGIDKNIKFLTCRQEIDEFINQSTADV